MIDHCASHLLGGSTEILADCSPSGTSNIDAPYAGARITRLNNHWLPRHVSGDAAVRQSWDIMTPRLRDRVRNDGILSKIKRTLTRLVIGTGINTYSDASELQEDNSDLVDYEIESDLWFQRWALEEADAENEHSLFELEQIAFGNEMEEGNALWLEVLDPDPARTIPLCYQLIEWEQVDNSKDCEPAWSRSVRGRYYNRISNGVEYDCRNRKVAFYVYDAHPYDYTSGWTSSSSRIPASRVLHEYWPHRPSAKVGTSWFAANLHSNSDLDKLIANELTTRALCALMGVAIKTSDRDGSLGLDATDPDTGLPTYKLGYPHIGYLRQDDEVEIHESKRGGADATAFINLLLNLQAMGCNLSLNRLLGDPAKANLASIKAAHQDDDDSVAPVQANISRKVLLKIRKAHTRYAFAGGLFKSFTARDYLSAPFRYNTFQAISGNRADLDKDDGEAAIDRLRAGLLPYQEECARRGLHWRRNLRRMAVVNKVADELGVVLDWTKGQGSAPERMTSQASDASEDTDATT